jgi:hypothetical protein
MANQIVVSAGAKVRNLDGVLTGTSGVVNSLPINASNGIPQLDVNGKILVSQLPNSVMEYKGTWNANTNTPTLVNGTGNQGDVYLCNVAGTTNFGAGPIAFVVGDQVIYSGTIWQRASGATGTVTSVAVTESGDSLNITGSPITTSGTINIGFNGTNLQYVNGAGNLTTFPTLITSIGLSMPSAFSVANSPLTANGTIAVTGAGVASQYIRGDGTLADFPSSGGGGSSVSYYLNGGTSQGTIGGTTYYEMSKTAVIGTGVDFALAGDGFIVAFLTDANDPAQLNIPAGNWNYEIYASMSANGGTPQMYAELYKYDGTTFTLIATSSNEIIYDGTALNLYTFAMAVPATSLTLTDRLAVKLYATNSGGKTTTIHTQDGHLCQVITTFSTGITALNGLTAQIQYFATGTSGSDFNISSATATHTFNIPDASATARGLITTGTQTIAGTKTFTGAATFTGSATFNNTLGNSIILNYGAALVKGNTPSSTSGVWSNIYAAAGNNNLVIADDVNISKLQFQAASSYTYTFPASTGTLALTSDLANYVDLTTAQTIGGTKTFTDATKNNGGIFLQNASSGSLAGYMNLGGLTNGVKFTSGGGISNTFTLPSATGYTFTFPNATGTIALTSDIPSITGLVPYTGATGSVNLGAYLLTASGVDSVGYTARGSGTLSGYLILKQGTTYLGNVVGYNSINANARKYVFISDVDGTNYKSAIFELSSLTNNTDRTYTLPDASGTIALVGGSGVGTVTSVAALTIGTSGTDLSSSVANSTTTPVITLNVPTASATNRGALSSADWTTFNNKQGTITLTTTGTSGAATFIGSTLNIPNYAPDLSGYVTLATTQTISGAKTFTNNVTIRPTSGYNAYFQTSGTALRINYLNDALSANVSASYRATDFAWQKGDGTDVLKLDASGNLGLGTSTPSYKLDVFDAAGTSVVVGAATGKIFIYGDNVGGTVGTLTSIPLRFSTNGTEKMRLDASGNLGLGVTPSAWTSGSQAFENSTYASSIYGYTRNAYFNGSSWIYVGSTFASRYAQFESQHLWYTAPSGTAGAAITFTQAMTLNAVGNLMMGTTTASTGFSRISLVGGESTGTGANTGIQLTYNSSTYGGGAITTINAAGGGLSFYTFTGNVGAESYSQAMTLYSSGNLLLQTGGTRADNGYKLDVNGTGRFSGNVSGGYLGITIKNNSSGTNAAQLSLQTLTQDWLLNTRTDNHFSIYNNTAGTTPFLLDKTTGAATFSSSITSTKTSDLVFSNTSGGTNRLYNLLQNTTGYLLTGIEGATAGSLVTGSTAYAGVITTNANSDLVFGTSFIKRLSIDKSTGAATFSSSVTSSGTITAKDTTNDASVLMTGLDGAYGLIQANNAAGSLTKNLVLQKYGGNVGIGCTPSYSLDVKSSARILNDTGAFSITNFYVAADKQGSSAPDPYNIGGIRSQFADSAWTSAKTILLGSALTGYGNPTERISFLTDGTNLITSMSGRVCIGVTTPYGSNLLNVNGGIYATSSVAAVVAADLDMMVFQNTGATYTKSCLVASMTATGGTGSYFFYGQQSTSTAAIKIFSNGNIQNTNNSYGAISDVRLKENIKDATPKLDDLMKVKVRNYNLKGESNKQLGVISQELEAIFPNMIEESTNMGENMKIKGVKYSVFVPMLIKAVQELKAEIEILKNK